jgi:murein DD-endopeptidase MepM/ murein hydrolase activator NlpD
MSALDDLKRDLPQTPDPTVVSIQVRLAAGVKRYDLTASELRTLLVAPFNQSVPVPIPDDEISAAWVNPVGDPEATAYPPPPWQRTNWLGAEYDLRLADGSTRKQFHTGDDLNLPDAQDLNLPVRAIRQGLVTYADDGGGTWLGVVVVQHPHDGTFTVARYAHLTGIRVRVGEQVRVGQVIGLVGDPAGRAGFEPHLHFDLGRTGDSFLLGRATDWPGANRDAVLQHYQDPTLFMRDKLVPSAPVDPRPTRPEPAGQWMSVSEPAGVNVRREPLITASNIVTRLPKGVIVKVDKSQAVGAFTFGQITDIEPNWALAVGNWVARNFLAPSAPPEPRIEVAPITPIVPDPSPDPRRAPQPQPGLTGSAIGVHVAFTGHHGDLLGVVERLARAGRPVPLVVVVTDTTLCADIKRLSPQTTTLYRFVSGAVDPRPFGDHEDAPGWRDGRQWFDEFWDQHGHSQVRGVDFHQMYNEVSFAQNTQSEAYARRVAQFELDFMHRANERGAKVTIGNYMPGVPEQRHIEQLRPALAFAEQFGHALCYHAYTYPNRDTSFTELAEYFALRWKRWVDPYPRLRVLLGEVGIFNSPRFRDAGTLIRMMEELDLMLRPLRAAGRRVDAAYWTIRGQNDNNWRHDDWTHALADYERWMLR